MWYRLYLAKMPKKEYEQMIQMSYEDFIKKYSKDWDDYIWIYEFTTELFEFWKYVDYSDWMERVEWKDERLKERYSWYSFNILEKDILIKIIDEYSENVANYYKSLIEWTIEPSFCWISLCSYKVKRKEKMKQIFKHLQGRYYDFSGKRVFKRNKKWKYKIFNWCKPYNIKSWPITSSLEYEYTIFELIRIYREFDSEKDVLLYYWC